jgi:catechol 2,3-dioxygenase-like lactoylglutathione lyase family enzyme
VDTVNISDDPGSTFVARGASVNGVHIGDGGAIMQYTGSMTSMSSDDVAASEAFYRDILGLTVSDAGMGGIVDVELPGGGHAIIYPKDDHQPATHTLLNFEVADIDAAVDELVGKGVEFERYGPDMHQDEKGIMRGRAAGMGPDQAWFTDPAGNILSILA